MNDDSSNGPDPEPPARDDSTTTSRGDPTAASRADTTTPTRDDPTPRSTPERDEIAFVLAFALVSILTAAGIFATSGAVAPAAGAAALALGFASFVFLSFVFVSVVGWPTPLELLAEAWDEHRRYVWFATGLFGLGALLGVALFVAGVDLLEFFFELFEETLEEELGEDPDGGPTLDLTATFFVVNNTPPFLAAILGALTLGLFTAFIMVFNGVLLGNVAVALGAEVGFAPIVALLLPHGIFELPALFVAAGVGFRFLHRAIQRVAGTREALFSKRYLARTALLVIFAWLVLVLAAFVEAYVTGAIAEFLFPQLAGDGGPNPP